MNTGQIIKSKTTKSPYTQIHNELIKTDFLTLEEKGLMVYILSLPDDWVLYRKNLYNVLPDSKGTIDRIFRSLQEKGYIISTKQIGSDGRFIGWNHIVYDKSINRDIQTPMSDNPSSVNADFGKTAPILNTNYIQKTNIIQKKEINIDFGSLTEPMNKWLDYKKEIKKPYKSEKSILLIFNKLKKLAKEDKGRAELIVEQSILNGWQGLFELKEEPKQTKDKPAYWDSLTSTQKAQWMANNGH